jgi:hypothetical protein
MKRLLSLMFVLLLSGCFWNWNQKQQLAACALEAGRHTSREDVPANYDYVEACMRTHGYELNQDQCPRLRDDVIKLDPAAIAALGEKLGKAYTENIEKRLAALAMLRKAEPTCYEPTGWFGKQVQQIEKSLGQSLGKSKDDAQIELIECAGFWFAIPQSLVDAVYKELRSRGTEPVNIRAMDALAANYRITYTATRGRGAEVSARWDRGVTAGKRLGEKGDVRRIAKYLISCVGTMNDALRD